MQIVCDCGSGEFRHPQYDARAIFLCYTCRRCHQLKMSRYRRDVITDPNYPTEEAVEED